MDTEPIEGIDQDTEARARVKAQLLITSHDDYLQEPPFEDLRTIIDFVRREGTEPGDSDAKEAAIRALGNSNRRNAIEGNLLFGIIACLVSEKSGGKYKQQADEALSTFLQNSRRYEVNETIHKAHKLCTIMELLLLQGTGGIPYKNNPPTGDLREILELAKRANIVTRTNAVELFGCANQMGDLDDQGLFSDIVLFLLSEKAVRTFGQKAEDALESFLLRAIRSDKEEVKLIAYKFITMHESTKVGLSESAKEQIEIHALRDRDTVRFAIEAAAAVTRLDNRVMALAEMDTTSREHLTTFFQIVRSRAREMTQKRATGQRSVKTSG